MLTRRLLSALLLAAALLAPAASLTASEAPDPRIVSEMTRYLKAIGFGETFLGGVRKANSAEGKGSAFLDRILQATPEEIETTVAPAFAGHVSLKEARAMADFFSSPLGQKAVALGRASEGRNSEARNSEGRTSEGQKSGAQRTAVSLTSRETSELEKFSESPAGQRAVALTTDSTVRREYLALIKARFDP